LWRGQNKHMTTKQATIQYGTPIEITTAYGERLRMRALDQPTRGRDFPVVLICTDAEFEKSEHDGTEPDGQYWPLDDLRPLEIV